MKKLISAIFAAVVLCLPAHGRAATDTYFPYPLVPDSISTLQGRCDFLITHFWDMCDLKKAFSSRARMAGAFRDYLSFMPHATPRKAFRSIAVFLKAIEKQPSDMLFIAQKAEEFVHSDTAMYSDQLYLPFAQAVANNGRISKEERAKYERQARLLLATMLGTAAPSIDYYDRTGAKNQFVPDSTQATIIFFNEPGAETSLARLRLDADVKATQLIKDGLLKVVSITRTSPGEEWTKMAESFPQSWVVGASPDIDNEYDITSYPSFYVLAPNGEIVLKNGSIAQMLIMLSNLEVSEVK